MSASRAARQIFPEPISVVNLIRTALNHFPADKRPRTLLSEIAERERNPGLPRPSRASTS